MSEITSYLESDEASDAIFLLPGPAANGKIRCLKTFRSLYDWLRSNGIEEQKPLHTLRKEAGSMLFEKLGSLDKAATFLRNDPRVAREHYVGRKERIELNLPIVD